MPPSLCPQLTLLVVQVSILYYGGHLVISGQMTSGNLISFIIYEFVLGDCMEVRGWVGGQCGEEGSTQGAQGLRGLSQAGKGEIITPIMITKLTSGSNSVYGAKWQQQRLVREMHLRAP